MEIEDDYAAKLFHTNMKVLHSICIIFVSQKTLNVIC